MTKDLAAVAAESKPADLSDDAFGRTITRKKVELCMRAIRAANPEDYGYLLVQRKLITSLVYAYWLGNLQAKVMQIGGIVTFACALLFVVITFFQPKNLLRYHHWRFTKTNATASDRDRTHKFISTRLLAATNDAAAAGVLGPVVYHLRYSALEPRIPESVLHLLVEYHHPTRNRVVLPVLVNALHTQNPDIRLRIHETLKALQNLDYPQITIDAELIKWVPSKNESAKAVEDYRRKHLEWWEKAKRP